MNTTTSSNRCLSFRETGRKVGLSRSTIYGMLADSDSDFPRPLIIGHRKLFLEPEIDNWILSRPRDVSKSKNGDTK